MLGTCDKLTPWANDGGTLVDAPSEAKIEHGWNVDEQPPAQWENWRVNRDNNKINELIDLHDTHCENDFVDTIAGRCSGLPTAAALLDPVNPVNRVELADPAIGAFCRGYDYEHKKECIFGLSANPAAAGVIAVISNDTDGSIDRADVTTNIPLDADLFPVDLCCDGFYIYILYYGDPDTELRIYRVPIGEDYANGVSTTYDASLLIDGEGPIEPKYKGYGGNGGKRICVADADNIAFLNDNLNEVTILPKTLLSHTSGTGNFDSLPAAITGGDLRIEGLCSDGDRIWVVYDGVLVDGAIPIHVLCAVLISNPVDSTAGLTRDWETDPVFWFNDIDGSNYMYDFGLAFDGRCVHVGLNGLLNGDHGAFDVVFDTDSELSFIPRYNVVPGSPDAGANNGGICFTGRHIALVSTVCQTAEFPDYDYVNRFQLGLALLKTSRGGFGDRPLTDGYAAFGSQAFEINDHFVTALEPTTPYGGVSATRVADVVFSDDCIWILVFGFRAGFPTVDDVYLIRVPAISARS